VSGISDVFVLPLSLEVLIFTYSKAVAVVFALAHATAARFQNHSVEASSTSHLFGLVVPTMIRYSDSPTLQGGKAPNQPSDGLFSTRVLCSTRSGVTCHPLHPTP
jgi:hypothetical protein